MGSIKIPNKVINSDEEEIKSLITSGLKNSRESLEKLEEARGILEESIEEKYLKPGNRQLKKGQGENSHFMIIPR